MSDDPQWYKDAIIYQLHIKAFFDSTDDGIGDFAGLTAKLDYIKDLGVNTIWLLPFYPSPLRDDGYDIAEYRDVNPSYGSMRDFRRFVREAHARGLRVITELVVNHTSDQHPWFKKARQAKPGSAARNYYVWSDNDQKYAGTRIIFTDTETSNWSWDPVANAYYWHRFFSHQPDLNFDNPQVLRAVIGVMQFWLDAGVDGLRLDAIPYLCEREGTINENLPETHAILKRIRAALDGRYDDRLLLGEANQWPEDVLAYFGDGDECHMAFHFPLMPRIYMAVAQEDRHPITDIMRQTPDIPENCQWAIFLRNHDELTLEMVTNRERDYLWSFYAGDPRMRINVGIRRRLAPLLDNDRRKIELLNSLLMSMPGTPVIYYGDEIGMGDNIYLGDRDGVRTPMQWSPDRNAGFSRADPARLYLPPIMDAIHGYEAVNVEAQNRSSASLLNWMKRLVAARGNQRAFGRGTLEFLLPGNRKILAYIRAFGGEKILCVANLSRAPQPVELDLSAYKGHTPIELMGNSPFPPIGELPYFVTLPGYGFYWFRLEEEAAAPVWHESHAQPIPELFTLVAPHGWNSIKSGAGLKTLENRVVPEFLANQRWFAAKGSRIASVSLVAANPVTSGRDQWLLSIFRVAFAEGEDHLYQMPLAITWEDGAEDPLARLLPFTLARVRKGATVGVLSDAIADDGFARSMVKLIGRSETLAVEGGGQVRFTAIGGYEGEPAIDALATRRLGAEQSNTSIRIGDDLMFKFYRKLEAGLHPEIEMGRYLSEQAPTASVPRLLGAVEYVDDQGQSTALGVLHQAIENQGDGWTYAVDYLGRFLEDAHLLAPEVLEEQDDLHGAFAGMMRTLGRRVAGLHHALATGDGGRSFRPEPVGAHDLSAWRRQARAQARAAVAALRRARKGLPPALQAEADTVIAARNDLMKLVDALVPARLDTAKSRFHGDLHLGQVLVVNDDFAIIDFEGEPIRALGERRYKHSPLRDLGGMLRSFDYVAWSAVLDRETVRSEAVDQLLPWAMDWREEVTEAFLDGYREAIDGCATWPDEAADARSLIALFTLEKALYEVCYEAANRPAWLRIPVRGVLRLLEGRA